MAIFTVRSTDRTGFGILSEPCNVKLTTQAKGLFITTTGVLAICPDTLLVRMLELDRWALIFYRGIIIAVGLTMLTALFHGRQTVNRFRSVGWPGFAVSILFTCGTISFVSALYYTTVANTLIVLSASSMFAALLSRLFLGERIALRTWLTMLVVTAAIAYIFSGDLGRGSLTGDCLALLASMSMASTFTVMRAARASNMIPATALSGILTAAIAFFPATFVTMPLRSLLLLALLGAVLITAFALLTLGPRYISAPEVSLLMPIETVVAPFLIWLVLGERPETTALIGGPVVLLALTAHSLMSLRSRARPMLD